MDDFIVSTRFEFGLVSVKQFFLVEVAFILILTIQKYM